MNSSGLVLADSWGREMGTRSAYMQSYAIRENTLNGIGGGTLNSENLGNNFRQWRDHQAAILQMQFQGMLINLIKYSNVPPTLNTAQLEIMLRSLGGGVCVGKDELGDLVILNRSDDLGWNYYGTAIPFFDQENYLSDKKVITNRNLKGDYVVFYNKLTFNDFYSTDYQIIEHYSGLLADIKATERMSIMQARTPMIIKSNKNGVTSQILMQKIYSGELAIDIDMQSDFENQLKSLPLNFPDRTQSMQNAYRNTLNEMLTLFGIYNNPETKKERLTAGESSANNHVIEAMGDIYFDARRQAVDLLNLAFGTKIEVQWNSTVATAFRDMITRR